MIKVGARVLGLAAVVLVGGCGAANQARTASPRDDTTSIQPVSAHRTTVAPSMPAAGSTSKQTAVITKPDPSDPGTQTVRQEDSCPAPGTFKVTDLGGKLLANGTVFLGTLILDSEIAQDKHGMLYTRVTVTGVKTLAGPAIGTSFTAYVPGGVAPGLVAESSTGVATGPDGHFLGLLDPTPRGLDRPWIKGIPIVGNKLYLTDTTCLQGTGVPGMQKEKVSYNRVLRGKPTVETDVVDIVPLDATLAAIDR